MYIRTIEGTFLLNVTGMIQARWTASNRQTDNRRLRGRSKQDDVNGFEVQYLVLNFDGYVHDPRLTYLISVIGDTDQGHAWETYYASAAYAFADELVISAGILDLPQGFGNLSADNEQQFVQNLIAGALRELADDVERPTRGQPGSESKPSDFWTDAVRIGLDALLNP